MKHFYNGLKAVVFFLIGINVAMASVTDSEGFTKALMGRDTQSKEQAIDWLVSTQSGESSTLVLNAWLVGDLYYFNDKSSPNYLSLYQIKNHKSGETASSVWSDETTSIEKKSLFKKIRVNNRFRGVIRAELASLGLNDSDVIVRRDAVSSLLGQTDDDIIDKLQLKLTQETDDKVIELIQFALAIDSALDDAAPVQQRVDAIASMEDEKHTVVFKTMQKVLSTSNNEEIVQAANYTLGKYEQSQKLYSGVETLFFGLSMGSVLVLAGIGLAITFGVMGVINMAHGELIMIGAYTAYVMQTLFPNNIAFALLLSIPMAFMVSGLVGVVIERTVIRHLYGRPLETLLATFGISLILQQAVRSIFSPLNRSVSTPEFMSGAMQLNPMLSLTYNRLYIIAFCVLVFFGLLMVLKKTPLGLQVRAVSQNRGMARAMGIRSERVDAMTFGLGSGVAGIAGVALSQLTNVGPNMGQAYIIDSFMVVVFGGVGNLWGTLVAGLSLGLFNKVLEPWAGAVLAKIIVLVFIILFIQKRPRGLFPQRGRAADS
ncbi:urea ABC transporter permease subunit UrtB [Vibrio breoganii]|uniref:Urea ABC transporter permease subunit UrtB n=1 Tax=Vibrio breoganii TaxID=553239 RepID=A0AAP8MV20_9VIBR|nr:urea ABC transporter permease subunit UrtB [Vibrio breoganii]PMK17785.1 urea ABC transporter permease subunit UrtB [Vibrio breoganii]PMM17161.1 urea ABC transporter permease subunit UrtB [Vibrio breoganii]PMP09086.1 urea ABC transporter permease subunit UrtB [Vibrio breoganii]TKF89958.1 urea ABC transporter permease subunit UrtB [Vibrio breoganii]